MRISPFFSAAKPALEFPAQAGGLVYKVWLSDQSGSSTLSLRSLCTPSPNVQVLFY